MRIATLQIASKLGDVQGNIKRADKLLRDARVTAPGESDVSGPGLNVPLEEAKLDILVLPELALTGYNFPSLEAIKPYLEEAAKGPCAAWARETAKRLGCKVCVGYPEIEIQHQLEEEQQQQEQHGEGKYKYYNSLLVVNEQGCTLLNYRKTFLYYTDETWASEGSAELGFHQLTFPHQNQNSSPGTQAQARVKNGAAILPPPPCSTTTEKGQGQGLGQEIATSFGICMDINPYRFVAPYTAYEFAHRVLDSNSQLVILSMAWLTLLTQEELENLREKPEMDTFNYWIQRFMPLLKKRLRHGLNADDDEGDVKGGGEKKIILVFANRAGEEGAGETIARYAGTSAVIAVSQRPKTSTPSSGGGSSDDDVGDDGETPLDVSIHCWGIMGAAAEGVCFADTRAEPEMMFRLIRQGG